MYCTYCGRKMTSIDGVCAYCGNRAASKEKPFEYGENPHVTVEWKEKVKTIRLKDFVEFKFLLYIIAGVIEFFLTSKICGTVGIIFAIMAEIACNNENFEKYRKYKSIAKASLIIGLLLPWTGFFISLLCIVLIIAAVAIWF